MGRLDRYGDPIEDHSDDQAELHPAECRNGWLGYTPDGRIVPCLICRPHLAQREDG